MSEDQIVPSDDPNADLKNMSTYELQEELQRLFEGWAAHDHAASYKVGFKTGRRWAYECGEYEGHEAVLERISLKRRESDDAEWDAFTEEDGDEGAASMRFANWLIQGATFVAVPGLDLGNESWSDSFAAIFWTKALGCSRDLSDDIFEEVSRPGYVKGFVEGALFHRDHAAKERTID